MKPWMSQKQIDLIQYYLNPTDTMLEYGAGGSTLYFSKYVNKYVSIEHDLNWVNKIKIQDLKENIELYHCGTDNPITLPIWQGNPVDFHSYISFIDTLPHKQYDKVLIDGRVRLECGIKVLDYLHKDSIVFVHDFFERERYHKLHEYYSIVDKEDSSIPTLAIFKPV